MLWGENTVLWNRKNTLKEKMRRRRRQSIIQRNKTIMRRANRLKQRRKDNKGKKAEVPKKI